jgi:branched-chain amino acid transport system ATP-binding protein
LRPLTAKHISKHFGGVQVLSDISLNVEAGERRVLLGPNGAGKTTLFNVISGLLTPSNGNIILFGKDATALSPHRRAAMGMGRTFQITNLFLNLTIEENLLLSLKAVDDGKRFCLMPLRSDKRLRSRADSLLEQSGLQERRYIAVRNLSYGEQRQVEVMMALAQRPSLLLLDEFTSGLSAAEIITVTRVLKSLPREITLLLIEHDMDVAFELGEFFTVLHMGTVFAEGSLEQIKSNKKVQEIYLGESQ